MRASPHLIGDDRKIKGNHISEQKKEDQHPSNESILRRQNCRTVSQSIILGKKGRNEPQNLSPEESSFSLFNNLLIY
jgi:hypothetical protein